MDETKLPAEELRRRVTDLVTVEYNRRQNEDAKYRLLQEEMFQYFKELKTLNKQYSERYKQFSNTGGPLWNEELSVIQRQALDELKLNMHMDIGQGTPFRTAKTMLTLGIFPNYTLQAVMKALKKSNEDPILFLRDLYVTNFNNDPTTKLDKYELEQKLLLSAIVHLELMKLIDDLNVAIPCTLSKHSVVKPPERKMKYKKMSPYLLKAMHVPVVRTNMYSPPATPKPALPLGNSFITKFGLFSVDNIYENVRCRNTGDGDGGSDVGKEGGEGEDGKEEEKEMGNVPGTEGFQGYPVNECGISCGCVRWFSGIVRYLVKKREREEVERQEELRRQEEARMAKMLALRKRRMKQFRKMKKGVPEDEKDITVLEGKAVIKERKKEPSIYPKQTKTYPIGVNEYLKTVLQGIPEDKYYILSLPDIHKLPKLQEWARFRLKGEIDHDDKELSLATSRRKWEILATQRLKISPPAMPFSKKVMFSMTWDSRSKVNRIAADLRRVYYKKVKRSLIQIGQVWWATMEAEKFHNMTFRNVYFSYIPAREMDIFMVKYDK